MRKPLTLFLTILYAMALAQITPSTSNLKEKRSNPVTDLFSLQSNRDNPWPDVVKEYSTLRLNQDQLKRLISLAKPQIEISIPSTGRSNIILQLTEVKQEPLSIKSAVTGKTLKYQNGKHYRGFVKGNEHSIVAISFFNDEVMGFISDDRSQGNLVLGKVGHSREDYVLYQDDALFGKSTLNCETATSGIQYDAHALHEDNHSRALSDCVRFYYEIDDDIVTEKGGATPAINYITGLHNQVAALYAAESINVVIAEVVVWETTSPYNGNTANDMLNQFTAYRNGFNGNFAMMLSYKASGGIAYVNTICNNDPDFRMGFSSIYNTYSTLPNYSWSVNVITHEFGHLFGSLHTHDCVWNGNDTAIDGCATPVGCADPGLPSVGTGTIMSYCHTTNVGVNFAYGFGVQPGNVIRNSVTNASCLVPCNGPAPTCTDGIQNGAETGVDCGGPTCPPCATSCTQNSGTLTLVFDDYPSETSWAITDSNGDIIFSGTNYTNPNETINVPVCLPNGCYSFTIFDSFGDGICCLYGNGSYTLVMNGDTLATGGQFANQAINPFCVTQAPTCTDGVQNGDETGIDCGGSCAACPTCTDGVQNGDETGIDCGGSCAACPTCTDGVQNGDETGIDCGGSCAACPTCTDGVQNGDETGIDCGGSCAACPTCTDGVQNGDETGVDCGGSCAACPTCTDGVQNGDETGIDCGGSCAACPTCTDGVQNGDETGVDCGGSCAACPTCTDGVQNGDETGIDCGGSCAACPTCTDGVQNGDETGIDCGGSCAACPTCTDGVQNGDETGIDCGGSCAACPTCTDGVQNGDETGIDCGGSCAACPTCTDGVQNGDETGVDCGGSCAACPTCTDGVQNGDETGIDCGGSCAACPTCTDGVQNGDETGVDCGGSCAACPTCTDGVQNGDETGVDCGGSCAACPTCTDGVQNGDETGIDCGGSCAACPTCTDGVQNGDETGIDCGGSCAACPTCTDGIQNGDETGIDCGGSCGYPQITIAESTNMCIDFNNYLTPSLGGTWTSSDTLVATVSNEGVILTVGVGSVYFTFTTSGGCTLPPTTEFTIYETPQVSIVGRDSICIGATTQLSPSSGGSWTFGAAGNGVVTVSNGGIVTGIGLGATTFKFTNAMTGCTSAGTPPVSVVDVPTVNIVGNSILCIGEQTTISASSYGTWSSSDALIASVDQSGTVSALASGNVYFIFTDGATGCSVNTGSITINPSPTININNSNLCIGNTSNALTTEPGLWTTNQPNILTIDNSGTINAFSQGTAQIQFTSIATGCMSQALNVVVNINPSIALIGSATICIGGTSLLSPSIGGTWASSDPSVAAVSNNGVVTGISAGDAYFTFTETVTGCTSISSILVTVESLASAIIVGNNNICIGNNTQLSPSSGGTWLSSDNTVAIVNNSGIVTAIGAGEAVFTFTNATNGCSSITVDALTVNDNPIVSINGNANICEGSISTLSPSSGGIWTSSNTTIATVNANGIVTAISAGNAQMTFTDASTGCNSDALTLTVSALPSVSINGSNAICIQATTSLNPSTGGTWQSSDPLVAIVNNSGIVTGLLEGSSTFTFTSSNTGCTATTPSIMINSSPSVEITGGTSICVGSTSTLTPSSGGTWTSSNVNAAIVSNNGVVNGINTGNANFTFTSSTTGCIATTSTLSVAPLPVASITGSTLICVGSTTTLSPSTGGTWTSTNPAIASVSNSGVATAISSGTSTFIYTDASTGCISNPSGVLTVNEKPTAIITGSIAICVGGSTTLTPTTGGTWASSNPNVATISNIGIATGITSGTVTFTFTSNIGCVSTPSAALTVNAKPTVAITGATSICVDATSTLSPSSGGTWVSSNGNIGSVSNNGIVTGISAGTTSFVFTSIEGCVSNATPTITIKALPVVSITGSTSICVGATTTLSPTNGGTWASNITAQATVTNAGVVTGVAAGTPKFTFTSTSSGCAATTLPVMVNAKPTVAITGATSICVGSTTTLSPTTGGTWVSNNTARATVTNGGIVTGISSGTVTFTFTSTAGCVSSPTPSVTVKAKPTASISGSNSICVGSTTSLSPTTGGTWVSSNTAIATVTNSGVVTGVSGGSVTFVFTNSTTGCSSNPTAAITIKEKPVVAITGVNPVCVGSTTTLSPATGGTWTSSASAKATVSNAGIVTGVAAGTATFTFTNSATGCVSLPTGTVTVTALPAISVTGSTNICIGSTTTLTPSTGGTWTSSNPAIASISNAGLVNGLSAGNATFVFTSSASGCSSLPSASVAVSACNNVGGYYFETGWDNWADGGIDAERYTGTNSAEGAWSIALRDNSAAASSMTSPTLALANYQSIKVNFKFKMVGVESGEDFWLQYSANGTTFTTVKAYARGATYANGVIYSDVVTLNVPQWTLTNNAKLRFVADASDDSDLFYIDAVVVNGYSTPQANSEIAEQRAEEIIIVNTPEFIIFPNPVNTDIMIQMDENQQDQENYFDVTLFDLNGNILLSRKYNFIDKVILNVSDIGNGLYILQIGKDKKVLTSDKINIIH